MTQAQQTFGGALCAGAAEITRRVTTPGAAKSATTRESRSRESEIVTGRGDCRSPDATELRQSLAGQPRADISDLENKRVSTLIKLAAKSTNALHRMWLEQAEAELRAGYKALARAGVIAIIREMRELGLGVTGGSNG